MGSVVVKHLCDRTLGLAFGQTCFYFHIKDLVEEERGILMKVKY